jgi:hypothetical protein
MFQLVGETDTILMLVLAYHDEEKNGQRARVWFQEPICFCPFCGTQLQTDEDVEKWNKRNTK